MKKWLIFFLIVLVIVAGCKTMVQEPAAEQDVSSEVTEDIDEIGSLEQDLDLEELPTEEDLDIEI